MKYVVTVCAILFLASAAFSQTPVKSKPSLPQDAEGFAPFPKEISYQGFLATGAGLPATDGSYTLQFDLYNTPSGGGSLWTETQAAVNVQKGLFSVRMGSVTPLPNYFYQVLFVEVTATAGPGIGSPVLFAPRTKLSASPYSLAPWQTSNFSVYYLYGNVGIGTQTPGERLTIDGDNNQFLISSTGDGISDIDYVSGGDPTWAAGTGWSGSAAGKNSFYWYNGGEKMSLAPGGELSVRAVTAADTVRANNFVYSTPKTGYITGSAFSNGRGLTTADTYGYSGGVFNNSATAVEYFEVQLNLPDGVTLATMEVYCSDLDATVQLSANVLRHTLATNSFAAYNGTSGVAFAGGSTTVTISPGVVIGNSQYAYTLEVALPNTINVRYVGYRATITYDSPGFTSSSGNRPGAAVEESNVSTHGPGNER